MRTRLCLILALVATQVAATASPKGEKQPESERCYTGYPSDVLVTYLTDPEASATREASARAIVEQSNIIRVHYGCPEPPAPCERQTGYTDTHVAVGGSHRGADGQSHPGVSFIFGKAAGNSREAAADDWIDAMKEPLAAGYSPVSACVLPSLPDHVRDRSTELAEDAVRGLAYRIEALEDEFSQLALIDSRAVEGSSLSFWYGFEERPHARSFTPVGDDWVSINFYVHPLTGQLRQVMTPAKGYPLQALIAGWTVSAADPELEEKILALIPLALQGLDAYERELAGQPAADPADGAPPARPRTFRSGEITLNIQELPGGNGDRIEGVDGSGTAVTRSVCAGPHKRYGHLVAFFWDFQTRVRAGDREGVLDRVHYPLRIAPGDDGLLHSRAEAAAAYDDLFDSDLIDKLAEIDPRKIFCNWQGAMIGNGILWAEVHDDRLVVITINR
jgi:hypothetical protein